VFIGDQSLAFAPRNVLAPPPQQPRDAFGSHVSNLQIDDRKIRSAGGGAAGLAQPIRRGKHTFGREKSGGITSAAVWREARASRDRSESRAVSGHGPQRLRKARMRSGGIDRIFGLQAGRGGGGNENKGSPGETPETPRLPYLLWRFRARRMLDLSQARRPQL
jgi:hypothetical protein